MPIYRGPGGSGDASTDATITEVTAQSAAAQSAAISAENSKNSASASASSAATSASNSAISAGQAETAKTAAETAQGAAETAQSNAEAAELLAEKWASEEEDTVVAGGKYSAYHWAQKAEENAATISSIGDLPDVNISASPEAGEILVYDDITGTWVNDALPAGSGDLPAGYNNLNWDTAYSWGNHAVAGYLTSVSWGDVTGKPATFTPAAHTHTKADITDFSDGDYATAAQGTSADTAFGWGNHASAGYLTAFTETDPTVGSHIKAITPTNITNWNTAFGWGNHASAGYLTSYTETDPVFSASAASGIVAGDLTNWDTAYGWGNHAAAGYASADDPSFTGRIEEEVFAVTGTTPALNPQNGTIQTWTLSGNSTPTIAAGFTTGSSLTLMIDDGTSYTITWPTIQWAGGTAPTLATTGYTVVELWKVGSTVYGALVGDMS